MDILVEALERFLAPIRERRAKYENRMSELDDILITGTRKAREVRVTRLA
jgi:tryptophanyl-tRNA synthetase